MRLPRIEALDLRDPAVVEARTIRWDWPVAPSFGVTPILDIEVVSEVAPEFGYELTPEGWYRWRLLVP